MNLNWKTILKKAGIILLSTLLFALCSGLLYITKMAGSINITRPETAATENSEKKIMPMYRCCAPSTGILVKYALYHYTAIHF